VGRGRAWPCRFPCIVGVQEGFPALLEGHRIPPPGTAWSVSGPGGDIPVVTFDQAHGPIRSVGYRVGGLAYSSDVSDLDDAGLETVRGCDLWIVDALRYLPHPTHAHLDRTLDWIERAGVRRAVLTNLHIDMDYKTLAASVPSNVEIAHDGWSVHIGL